MFFNSGIFIVSFLGFFGLYHARQWKQNTRVFLVLVASLLFYFVSDSGYLPLLAAVIIIHFLAGKVVPESRRAILLLIIVLDVSILIYFKFIRRELHLPLGLSFYIFQCLAWLIDIRSERIKPDQNLLEFAGSVAYFPHLPAGPIINTKNLKETFSAIVSWDDCKAGILFFSLGVAKKTIADLLAPITETYLSSGSLTYLEACTGSIAGLARIYGDFSGYTDMAWGLSLLLGFRLPVNFFRPFYAQSVTSYYSERWHISLARWIREYLFIPLSIRLLRKEIPVELGILLSFLIMSLWHGSDTTFIFWGLYVALLIIMEERMKLRTGRVGIIRTNLLVMLGLILFYSKDLGTAGKTFQSLILLKGHPGSHGFIEFILTCVGFGTLIVLSLIDEKSLPKISPSKLFWPIVTALALLGFLLGSGHRSFIYFDF